MLLPPEQNPRSFAWWQNYIIVPLAVSLSIASLTWIFGFPNNSNSPPNNSIISDKNTVRIIQSDPKALAAFERLIRETKAQNTTISSQKETIQQQAETIANLVSLKQDRESDRQTIDDALEAIANGDNSKAETIFDSIIEQNSKNMR